MFKGTVFSVKRKSVEYWESLLPVELFFWDMKEKNKYKEVWVDRYIQLSILAAIPQINLHTH